MRLNPRLIHPDVPARRTDRPRLTRSICWAWNPPDAFQRYAFTSSSACLPLIAAIHGPRCSAAAFTKKLLWSPAQTYYVYLEHNPPKIFDCGADVGYVGSFPLDRS